MNRKDPAGRHLEEAYKQTLYHVADLGFRIRCDQYHPDLDAWLQDQGWTSWAFITAYNPLSQMQTAEMNQQNTALLALELAAYPHYPASGVPLYGAWPPEPGFFIINMSEEAILALGRQFRQYAVVFGERGKASQLLWCFPEQEP